MDRRARDTHPDAERAQIALLRQANPARRFQRARSLSRTTVELARRALRRRLGDVPEREVLLAFVAQHYGADLARRVRADLDRRGR